MWGDSPIHPSGLFAYRLRGNPQQIFLLLHDDCGLNEDQEMMRSFLSIPAGRGQLAAVQQ